MKILTFRERADSEVGMSIAIIGGPCCGEKFRQVVTKLEDGSEQIAWVSSNRPGFFKQVFVPFELGPSEEPVFIPSPTFQQIAEILDGIEHTELERDNGWWETSDGARYGTETLAKIKALFSQSA